MPVPLQRALPSDSEDDNDLLRIERVAFNAEPEAIVVECSVGRLTRFTSAYRPDGGFTVMLTPSIGTDWGTFFEFPMSNLWAAAERHLIANGLAMPRPQE